MTFQILLVDDEPLNRQILTFFLRSLEYDVIEAENGIQALQHIETNRFDLILLDISMPDILGTDVLRIVNGRRGGFKVPIIILTALDEEELKATCARLGAYDYLLKPYDLNLLENRIRSALLHER